MTEQTCQLCKRPAELSKSHILPKLAYTDIIDTTSHPRMVVVRDVAEGRISDTSQQSGYWERMLCKKCENQFSKYETYASNHLLNANLQVPKITSERVVTLKVDDYRMLKLFLLSLLWRVGVAKGDFFRCVKLGPHQDRLREMLHAEDPGEPDDYGCLITPLLPELDIRMESIVAMPHLTRTDGHNGCLLAFRGFVFQYYISRHQIPAGVRQAFLNKNGELMMVWARIGNFEPLRKLWNRCVKAIHRESRDEGVTS